MQTRLIQTLARQHYAALHNASERRLEDDVDRQHKKVRALAKTGLFGGLGRFRSRLASQTTRTEPAAQQRNAEAFPLWQAAKAGLARFEARVEAAEQTIEAEVLVQAAKETVERMPDKTSEELAI